MQQAHGHAVFAEEMFEVMAAIFDFEEEAFEHGLSTEIFVLDADFYRLAELLSDPALVFHVVFEPITDVVNVFVFLIDVGELDVIFQAGGWGVAEQGHAFGNGIELKIYLLVVALQKHVDVMELRAFHQPVVLVVLSVHDPQGSKVLVKVTGYFFTGFIGETYGVSFVGCFFA